MELRLPVGAEPSVTTFTRFLGIAFRPLPVLLLIMFGGPVCSGPTESMGPEPPAPPPPPAPAPKCDVTVISAHAVPQKPIAAYVGVGRLVRIDFTLEVTGAGQCAVSPEWAVANHTVAGIQVISPDTTMMDSTGGRVRLSSQTAVLTGLAAGSTSLTITLRGAAGPAASAEATVVPLPEVPRFSTISAGIGTTCALSLAGAVYCWGRAVASDGATPSEGGDGTGWYPLGGTPFPWNRFPGFRFVSLDARGQACGMASGGVWCWRPEGDPVAVEASGTLHGVTTGAGHSCALDGDDRAFCWGSNVFGQLGDSTFKERSIPVAVVGGLRFRSLSVGGGATCGVSISGQLHCWGMGNNPALQKSCTLLRAGGKSRSEKVRCDPVPARMQIKTAPEGDTTFTAVTLGAGRAGCALATSGRAFCWGAGSVQGRQVADSLVRPLPSPDLFATLTAGYDHACGLTMAHEAACWGRNEFGQLGEGHSTDLATTPRRVVSPVGFAVLSAGFQYTCGLTSDGRAFCWGLGERGQLGNGSGGPAATPVPVLGQR